MAVELFKHNLDAYNAAKAMLDETGKAFIVHPTGTGKSFIGLSLQKPIRTRVYCGLHRVNI